MNPNEPLVPKITFGECGDDNRVTVTIDMVALSSTYDAPCHLGGRNANKGAKTLEEYRDWQAHLQ